MSSPIQFQPVVLKFGSSVLRDRGDLPRVVSEVYARWRLAKPVVAVVSAFRGRTDELLALASVAGDDPGSLPGLIGLGEQEAAAATTIALRRAGLPARLIAPHEVGIRASGDPLEAEPVSVDPRHIEVPLEAGEIAVVPGYVARGMRGEPVVLGRGGSDLTAVRLAHALGATLELVKGSGGVFEWDPGDPGPAPRVFRSLSYDEALALGDRVLQPRAIEHARQLGVSFRVVGIGGGEQNGTLVGAGRSRFGASSGAVGTLNAGPLRIALLGLGTVGGGVATRLAGEPDRFELVGALVRDPARSRDGIPESLFVTDEAGTIFERRPDLVIELIGGIEPAGTLIERALASGADVITANKALLADHAPKLERTAEANGRILLASAAAGGALPVLEFARIARQAGGIRRVRGILNGTTNFVLDRLREGRLLDEVLQDAHTRGYAEADATADITSLDAARKLVCLARALGIPGLRTASIDRDHLTADTPARTISGVTRQIAEIDLSGPVPRASVRLRLLPSTDPLAAIPDATNAIEFTLADGRTLRARAAGAGRWPTTESVFADVQDIQRTRCATTRSATVPGSCIP